MNARIFLKSGRVCGKKGLNHNGREKNFKILRDARNNLMCETGARKILKSRNDAIREFDEMHERF